MTKAADYLYSWNDTPSDRYRWVKIEDDIREVLQGAHAVRPTTSLRKELLTLSDRVGVDYSLVGFPASSQMEQEACSQLIRHAVSEKLRVLPVLMARPVEPDLRKILSIRDAEATPVTADVFFSTSELRMVIEGWIAGEMLEKMKAAASFSRTNRLDLRVSLEDSSRTSPVSLRAAVETLLDLGPKAITLCDTAGDCYPDGVARICAFVRNINDRLNLAVEIGWHGHNDRGLSLANALSAIEHGADVISGTFTGTGERTGNVPLEQLIYILYEAGSKHLRPDLLPHICDRLSASVNVQLPAALPIVGENAFSTSTGTHVAAMLRAQTLGEDFTNLAFSAVDASLVRRRQTFLLGPNSGRNAVRAKLQEWGLSSNDEVVDRVVSFCKTSSGPQPDQAVIRNVAESSFMQSPVDES